MEPAHVEPPRIAFPGKFLHFPSLSIYPFVRAGAAKLPNNQPNRPTVSFPAAFSPHPSESPPPTTKPLCEDRAKILSITGLPKNRFSQSEVFESSGTLTPGAPFAVPLIPEQWNHPPHAKCPPFSLRPFSCKAQLHSI